MAFLPVFLLRAFLPGVLLFSACTQPPSESSSVSFADQRVRVAADSVGYSYHTAADPNGIGKYYYGRQIAHVMGHEGADWLERADRQQEEGTDLLLHELHLKPTDVVADIGAGTGYFSFRISQLVPQGKVLAVDIQPEMITALQQTAARTKVSNVQPVLSTVQNPNLPDNGVDLVLIVDAYHEFDHPREMMQAIRKSLTPTGRVALVEYRAEDSEVPIKRVHKMSVAQARKELEAVGLKFEQSVETLPQQHLMFFGKGR
ncbi:class I SAM-dependent methyltransferase [Hymenobacter sp. BT491]|uniref:class I SAM-dependent methyltransferase n=1 Tax=Hymenobacter sp. BT491 TaxID=2766779 RepID=UPI00165371F8|nr:methyltransferase domain-containing protein [Hymenobacter sp. BT491]MBC6990472.1 class I SAM-dependent methyltransferase [Hymenobacter sp. BT491]